MMSMQVIKLVVVVPFGSFLLVVRVDHLGERFRPDAQLLRRNLDWLVYFDEFFFSDVDFNRQPSVLAIKVGLEQVHLQG